MILELVRIRTKRDSTLGVLYKQIYEDYHLNGPRDFLCFTLEDGPRKAKIPGQTRIPAGTYQIELRTEGGNHARYLTRFKSHHRGMLWLRRVPDFEYIYIHIGNTVEDTAGCILVGEDVSIVGEGLPDILEKSTAAYFSIYPMIAGAIQSGEPVYIKIVDFEGK